MKEKLKNFFGRCTKAFNEECNEEMKKDLDRVYGKGRWKI